MIYFYSFNMLQRLAFLDDVVWKIYWVSSIIKSQYLKVSWQDWLGVNSSAFRLSSEIDTGTQKIPHPFMLWYWASAPPCPDGMMFGMSPAAFI